MKSPDAHAAAVAMGHPATERGGSGKGRSAERKALTIGAVAKILSSEFEDISISKIRYLEEQKLVSPRRTPGGYRLYSQEDVERLRTILRMQRDEFLPLRVIRQELALGPARESAQATANVRARVVPSVTGTAQRLELDELMQRTGASAELIGELKEHRIAEPMIVDGRPLYEETDVGIIRAAAELAAFGIAARNLRVLRTSADREASLLEQVVAPALRSGNPARRREAVSTLEGLAAACSELTQLMLVRDLRRLTGE